MLTLAKSLNREVAVIMVAACAVLLLVSIASQFRIYIEAVARGALEASSIVPVMFNLLPQFLGLILPLAFYVGVVVGLVRWQKDNELICIYMAGLGQLRYALVLMPLTIVVTLICAALQFYITPAGVVKATVITESSKTLDAFEIITPKRFTPLAKNMQIYTSDIDADETMNNIFVYSINNTGVLALLARTANITRQEKDRYFRLNQGHAYSLYTSTNKLEKFKFDSADIDITPEMPRITVDHLDALPTIELIFSDDLEHQSLLWWRISMVLFVPILFFGVVVTQRVTPRRGIGMRLMGVFLLCFGYLGLLYSARSISEEGVMPAFVAFLGVHLLILFITISWYRWFKN